LSAARTLAALAAAGAALRVDGPRLVLVGPRTLPLVLRAEVRAHAAELRGLLASAAPPAPVDHQVEQLQDAGHALGYLNPVELDGIRRLGPIRGRAAMATPSAAVDSVRAAAWRQAHQRRLDAGLDPESAARLTTTTHGPRPA